MILPFRDCFIREHANIAKYAKYANELSLSQAKVRPNLSTCVFFWVLFNILQSFSGFVLALFWLCSVCLPSSVSSVGVFCSFSRCGSPAGLERRLLLQSSSGGSLATPMTRFCKLSNLRGTQAWQLGYFMIFRYISDISDLITSRASPT